MTVTPSPAHPDRAALVESLRWRKLPVLDDGFVALVDCMGDDGSVVDRMPAAVVPAAPVAAPTEPVTAPAAAPALPAEEKPQLPE